MSSVRNVTGLDGFMGAEPKSPQEKAGVDGGWSCAWGLFGGMQGLIKRLIRCARFRGGCRGVGNAGQDTDGFRDRQ